MIKSFKKWISYLHSIFYVQIWLNILSFGNQNIDDIISSLLELMVNTDIVFKNKQMLRYLKIP